MCELPHIDLPFCATWETFPTDRLSVREKDLEPTGKLHLLAIFGIFMPTRHSSPTRRAAFHNIKQFTRR